MNNQHAFKIGPYPIREWLDPSVTPRVFTSSGRSKSTSTGSSASCGDPSTARWRGVTEATGGHLQGNRCPHARHLRQRHPPSVDLDTVESELKKVHLSTLYRDQICKDLHEPLGVRVDLLRAVGQGQELEARTNLGFCGG